MILPENWVKVLPPAALLIFAAIAGWNITAPGLYYDELLFVNAALGGKSDMFIAWRLGDLPVMLMPYIGALKAWLYYPVFKLLAVTAYSIRWPAVAVGVLTLWVNYKWMETAFSRRAALFFIILAAVEPTTIFHTRLDWGPTALMMLFRGLLFLSVFQWIRQRKAGALVAAVVVSAFGVFDKLNFIWFPSAVLMALLLVYSGRVFDFIKSRRREVIVSCSIGAVFAAGLILYVACYVAPVKELLTPDWTQRWTHFTRNMLEPTVGGAAVYGFIIGNNREIVRPQLLALGVALLAALAVLTATKPASGERRNMGFFGLVVLLTLLQMFVTRRATGPHHAAMIAPLWLVPVSVWLARPFDAPSGKRRVLKSVALAAAGVVVLSSLAVDAAYLRGFRTQVLNPRWSEASYDLVAYLKTQSDRPVICVDWGFGTTIYALTQGKATVYDLWPQFKDGLSPPFVRYVEDDLLKKRPLFVTFAAGNETFRETRRHFLDIASQRNWQPEKIKIISDRRHQAVIEVYETGGK